MKLLRLVLFLAGLSLSALTLMADSQDRPNILWITIEDWSADLSCYGTKGLQTPYVDKLAEEGIRFEQAFTIYPHDKGRVVDGSRLE